MRQGAAVFKYVVLRYNLLMRGKQDDAAEVETIRALAEFRHQLRRFLHFSESAAEQAGLQPQQHQLLLQVAGAPGSVAVTTGYVAGRMGLRPNSALELCDRCVQAGLLNRSEDAADRRRTLLALSRKGQKLLGSLSVEHARELNELRPQLIKALSRLKPAPAKRASGAARRAR
jgi:DNA-binding MarR family transcriptional regulator